MLYSGRIDGLVSDKDDVDEGEFGLCCWKCNSKSFLKMWRKHFSKSIRPNEKQTMLVEEMSKKRIVSSRENISTHEFNESSPVDQFESSQSIESEPTLSTSSEVSHVPLDVAERKSNKYWTVDLEDATGMIKECHLRLKDMWVLSRETKIIVHWNEHGQLIGESGGLLGLFLGAVAENFKNFPISYEKWPLVPTEPYKNGAYRDIIQRFFKVDDGKQKKYILQNLGRK
ncbi:uncharacterized protein LOC107614448 [Arachis ipaensis]|uniref:uncharacterized protein LOC107614448 n=1 Tax=Arachis ipaensis TaxID=130454 RepID=UPI000A2B03D7|nr:uncharacterized protein LOC107614448 [Arachis ipaensis]